MKTKHNTSNTSEITCPYCGYEYSDSWEFNDELSGGGNELIECPHCYSGFEVNMEITVTYNSWKKTCEDGKHDFKHVEYFCKKHKFATKGKWIILSEDEWEYYKIVECKDCDEQEYIKITKEKFVENNNEN